MNIRGEDGKIAHIIHPTIGPCCVLEKDLDKFPGAIREEQKEVFISGKVYFYSPSTRYQNLRNEDGSIAFEGEVFDRNDLKGVHDDLPPGSRER